MHSNQIKSQESNQFKPRQANPNTYTSRQRKSNEVKPTAGQTKWQHSRKTIEPAALSIFGVCGDFLQSRFKCLHWDGTQESRWACQVMGIATQNGRANLLTTWICQHRFRAFYQVKTGRRMGSMEVPFEHRWVRRILAWNPSDPWEGDRTPGTIKSKFFVDTQVWDHG